MIKVALEDGVLTEKEKQVLLKKAQSMGIDPDEFEMVLDARLVKLEKEKTPTPNNVFENYDYRSGKKARQRIVYYSKYIMVAIALLIVEFVTTSWLVLLLGPITIFVLVVIARNHNEIRGFLGLKMKKDPD